MFKKSVLPSGLRLITEPIAGFKGAYIRFLVCSGSRDDPPGMRGASHFVEHMLFKGTKTRSARELSAEVENLGGSLEAYTTRESVSYSGVILGEYIATTLDILTDMFTNSVFEPSQMELERKVILEEVDELLDVPSQVGAMFFLERLYEKNPLGDEILGKREDIEAITREELLRFVSSHYTADNLVVAAVGDVEHEFILHFIQRNLHITPTGKRRRREKPDLLNTGTVFYKPQKNQQVHIFLGAPLFAYNDKRRYAVALFNEIFGGGSTSILFQRVREEEGLAYSVYSYAEFFTDTGFFLAYAGVSPENTDRTISLILNELESASRKPFPANVVGIAKQKIKGRLMLEMENPSFRIARLLENELMLRRVVPLSETLEMLGSVTPEDIISIASEFLSPEHLMMLVWGAKPAPIDGFKLEEIA
ncbi:insulinase family protein [bacterium]|nr:insulinase family protein [bacterium]